MRTVIYRQNGGECSVTMLTGKVMAQKIDVSEMTQDQRVETMGLSIQWMKEGARRRPAYNAAHTQARRKARVVEDLNLSAKVAEYAEQMAQFTAKKREARSKARLEQLNKMLSGEGQ